MRSPGMLLRLTLLSVVAIAGYGSSAQAQYGQGWVPNPSPFGHDLRDRGPRFDPYDRGFPPGRYDRGYHQFGPSHQLQQLAGELIAETQMFLNAFAPTAHIVPQGRSMQRDAERLYQAALELNQSLALGGDPRRIRSTARDIENSYNSLSRRVDRVARGRVGPNIARMQTIGFVVGDLLNAVATSGGVPGRVSPWVRF